MAELKLPVFMRVGDGPEFHIADIVRDLGTEDASSVVPRLLRRIADEMERQRRLEPGGGG